MDKINNAIVYVGGNKPGLLAALCRFVGNKLHWLWLSQKGWQTTVLKFGSESEAIDYMFREAPHA